MVDLPVSKFHLVPVGRTGSNRVECPLDACFQAGAEVDFIAGCLRVVPDYLQRAFGYQPFCAGPHPERAYPGLLVQRPQTACLEGAVCSEWHYVVTKELYPQRHLLSEGEGVFFVIQEISFECNPVYTIRARAAAQPLCDSTDRKSVESHRD